MRCKECGHYELFKMITSSKSFSYAGYIPCLRCKHYHFGKTDEFVINNPTQPEKE